MTDPNALLREVKRRIEQAAGSNSEDWQWFQNHARQTLRALVPKIDAYLASPTMSAEEVTFEKGLAVLINKHSKENESNTPDWLLAQYLLTCLAAFNTAIQQRETWYGRDARPRLDLSGKEKA